MVFAPPIRTADDPLARFYLRIDRGGGDHANLFPFLRLSTESAESHPLLSTTFSAGTLLAPGWIVPVTC